jgi:DNA-binding GntR family transcriptional regulator
MANGNLAAGSAVSELSLARQLGLSRTPIREAIGQLIAEGLLQRSSLGAVVVEATRQDIIELYELREALEVYAIGKVAKQPPGARVLEVLEGLVQELRTMIADLKRSGRATLDGEPLKKFITCDMRFHLLLLQAAGNQRMLKIIDSTNLLLRVFSLRREHHTPALLEEVHRFHREILKAVVQGAPKEAAKLLGDHIRLSLDERLAEHDNPPAFGRSW